MCCQCGAELYSFVLPLDNYGRGNEHYRKITVYDTTSFVNYVRSDINVMIGLARKNEFEARYQQEKKACVESMVAQFKAEKEELYKQAYDYGDYVEVYDYVTVNLTYESSALGTIVYSFGLSLNPETVADSVANQFES